MSRRHLHPRPYHHHRLILFLLVTSAPNFICSFSSFFPTFDNSSPDQDGHSSHSHRPQLFPLLRFWGTLATCWNICFFTFFHFLLFITLFLFLFENIMCLFPSSPNPPETIWFCSWAPMDHTLSFIESQSNPQHAIFANRTLSLKVYSLLVSTELPIYRFSLSAASLWNCIHHAHSWGQHAHTFKSVLFSQWTYGKTQSSTNW